LRRRGMNKIRTVSKVLRIKEWKKEDLEAEVKKVTELIRMEKALLTSLEKTFDEALDMYEERQGDTSVHAQELELFSCYFSQLSERIERQKAAVIRRLAELEEVRLSLIETHRDKKLLEILEKKMLQEDLRQKEMAEQKEMDFLFLMKRGKK
jgi:flagellar FliJ protein